MRNRTLSRQLALQFLYQADLRGEEGTEDLDSFLNANINNLGDFLQNDQDTEEFQVNDSNRHEIRSFAKRLAQGTRSKLNDLDEKIQSIAKNWRLDRMAVIDRNILRMAVWELLYGGDIPPIVSINEAIELAKLFSTEKSSSFVNGILDKINLERDGQHGNPNSGDGA